MVLSQMLHPHRPQVELRCADTRVTQDPREPINVTTAPDVGNREAVTEGMRVNMFALDANLFAK